MLGQKLNQSGQNVYCNTQFIADTSTVYEIHKNCFKNTEKSKIREPCKDYLIRYSWKKNRTGIEIQSFEEKQIKEF